MKCVMSAWQVLTTMSTKEQRSSLPALALEVLRQKERKLSGSVMQSTVIAKISRSADRKHGTIKKNISTRASIHV